MEPKTKLIAVLGGGDWADASVDHLVIPENVDIENEKNKRQKWYNEEYRRGMEYYSFPEWLIKFCGARRANENEITETEDD